jgi:hypothetical protein
MHYGNAVLRQQNGITSIDGLFDLDRKKKQLRRRKFFNSSFENNFFPRRNLGIKTFFFVFFNSRKPKLFVLLTNGTIYHNLEAVTLVAVKLFFPRDITRGTGVIAQRNYFYGLKNTCALEQN